MTTMHNHLARILATWGAAAMVLSACAGPTQKPASSAPSVPSATSETPPSDPGPQASSPSTSPCVKLDKLACQKSDSCFAVVGRRYVEKQGAWCLGEREFVACRPKPAGCGDALTEACSEPNAVYMFDDTCIPVGWRGCTPPTDSTEACGP